VTPFFQMIRWSSVIRTETFKTAIFKPLLQPRASRLVWANTRTGCVWVACGAAVACGPCGWPHCSTCEAAGGERRVWRVGGWVVVCVCEWFFFLALTASQDGVNAFDGGAAGDRPSPG
jgi:hypothetical protein